MWGVFPSLLVAPHRSDVSIHFIRFQLWCHHSSCSATCKNSIFNPWDEYFSSYGAYISYTVSCLEHLTRAPYCERHNCTISSSNLVWSTVHERSCNCVSAPAVCLIFDMFSFLFCVCRCSGWRESAMTDTCPSQSTPLGVCWCQTSMMRRVRLTSRLRKQVCLSVPLSLCSFVCHNN